MGTAAASEDDPAAVLSFSYHRSIGPMLGVLLGIALVETVVVHIVAMALWGWKVAVALAVVDLSAVAMLVRLLRSFRTRPVTIEGRRLVMRLGHRTVVPVDIDDIAGFRTDWDAAAIKSKSVLNLALIAWPNVVFDLARPIEVRRRRIISTIAHRLDDPVAFHAAMARLEGAHGDR
ncbi:hypothetical protein [Sphingomonas sp. PR090111-T3T-6A]|uniref:hypothetical protein n=1 Tax=Sphingomonas sp. PR090111-T3T-6A TaxID=685778 RepID=UPI00036D21E3|nr:hypothetical protein [Sphingomonas sp. PR090111-T3T-6A]